MLYLLDLLLLEADRSNEAAAAAAADADAAALARFVTSLCLVVETLPGLFPSPTPQSSFGMFANCVWAIC